MTDEAIHVFFPIAESALVADFLGRTFSADLVNRSDRSFEVRSVALLYGAVSMGNSDPRPYIAQARVLFDGSLELVVNGLKDKRHFIEKSNDLKAWTSVADRVFTDYVETFAIPPAVAATPVFVRVSRP